MTKRITKIIAALGVVAGLGIAALPLGSYAAPVAEDVLVKITIEPTTGTVDPDCGDAEYAGAAGAALNAECEITGSSNTGISIAIRDTGADTTLDPVSTISLALTAPGGATIPTIGATANITSANFIFANINQTYLNSGAGGWGYNFIKGTSSNLDIKTGYEGYNGVTASDVIVAESPSATTATVLAGAKFNFRAVTPITQAPGVYTNWVTITVSTLD